MLTRTEMKLGLQQTTFSENDEKCLQHPRSCVILNELFLSNQESNAIHFTTKSITTSRLKESSKKVYYSYQFIHN